MVERPAERRRERLRSVADTAAAHSRRRQFGFFRPTATASRIQMALRYARPATGCRCVPCRFVEDRISALIGISTQSRVAEPRAAWLSADREQGALLPVRGGSR